MSVAASRAESALATRVDRLLRVWRARLAIDHRWEITVVPSAEARSAKIGWVPGLWQAELVIPTTGATSDSLERSVIHELLELQSSDEIEVFWSLLDSLVPCDAGQSALRRALLSLMETARNRRIECGVRVALEDGVRRRPGGSS